MGNTGAEYEWAVRYCLASGETSPAVLLEELMGLSECPAFGPVHHVLVGLAALACLRNAQGGPVRGGLADELAEVAARAAQVPGGACARWGICGAAVGVGIAFAVANGNAPLREDGWRENQLMVARISERIARSGRARCCKRDARIAARCAAGELSRAFGAGLSDAVPSSACAVAPENSVCLGGECPFHAS